MKWDEESGKALSRVPFFVRKRVKQRVEEAAHAKGAKAVKMSHMNACRKRFLTKREKEVKGYGIETCFGAGGCPNRACHRDLTFRKRTERVLDEKDLKKFLRQKVKGPLKMHHEFRVSLSDCPNGCSRPQIADFGLLGTERPFGSQRITLQRLRGLPGDLQRKGHSPCMRKRSEFDESQMSRLRTVHRGMPHPNPYLG